MAAYQEVHLPIKAIHQEMVNNAHGSVVAQIRFLNRLEPESNPEDDEWCKTLGRYSRRAEEWCENLGRYGRQAEEWLSQPADRIKAYLEWIEMVAPGKEWDHKAVMKKLFGEWTVDYNLGYLFNFDIWSNIHYGYIGSACEFTEWELLGGAGAAQVYAGTNPPGYWDRRFSRIGDADFLSAFDDPKDQEAIKIGIGLWNRQRTSISVEMIHWQVVQNLNVLNTRSAPLQRYDFGYKVGFA